jgi:DNA-binding MarR family transcriptional regulator
MERPLVLDIFRLMQRADRQFSEKVIAAIAATPGFESTTLAYASVMRHMSPKGSRITDIAKRAGVTKQAIGQIVAQMEADGVVEVVSDPDDARAKIVRIPRSQMGKYRQASEIVAQQYKDVEARLGKDGVAKLHELLTKLVE